MDTPYRTYEIALFFAALISAAIGLSAWRRRSEPSVLPFALLMFAVAFWCLTSIAEFATPTLAGKMFWIRLEFIGILIIPTAWLAGALQWVYRDRWQTRRWLPFLIIVPVATLILAWTNDLHRWVWTGGTLVQVGPVALAKLEHGPAFWGHTFYSYVLMWAGTMIMIRQIFGWWHFNRLLAFTLLVGSLIPWLGNLAYLAGSSPFANLDLTPLAFALSGLVFATSVFHFRLLDIAPMAHDAVFEHLGDGVMVIDAQGRVADANLAARQLIDLPAAQFIGQPIGRVFARDPIVAEHLDACDPQPLEIEWTVQGERRAFDMRTAPLRDRLGRPGARILSLHDITKRLRAEEALRQSEDQYRAISAELECRVNERTVELAETNAALRSQVAERKQVEATLLATLAEKECMLMEINHRVKNNLQVVSSILSLQEKALDRPSPLSPLMAGKVRRQVIDALKDSQNRVRSMGLIHEMLYHAQDLAQVDFGDYVRNLGAQLFRSFDVQPEAFRLVVDIQDIRLGLELAVPCGLIVNELISNALKHAFMGRTRGEIRVALRTLDERGLQLVVADDGIGLPEEITFAQAETLGLQVVSTLVGQLDGTIAVVRHPGTEFRMTLNRPGQRT